MFIFMFFCLMALPVQSYSFCKNCVHYNSDKTDTVMNCNLFRKHPLYKDRQDVDFIGKEICSEKGKYFISGLKKEDGNSSIYEQNTKLFPLGKQLKNRRLNTQLKVKNED